MDELTINMKTAIQFAKDNGAVFAGYNMARGSRFRVAASTLLALEKRGLLTTSIGPDGGMMGRLTEKGERS